MKKELRHQIWDLLEEQPRLMTGEIAKKLQADPLKVSKAISVMVKDLNLNRSGKHGFYRYTVISRPISKKRCRVRSRITTKQRIYTDLCQSPDSTTDEVADRLNRAFNTIRECIREMAEDGHLTVSGFTKVKARRYRAAPSEKYSIFGALPSSDNLVSDIQSRGNGVWAVMAAQLIKE